MRGVCSNKKICNFFLKMCNNFLVFLFMHSNLMMSKSLVEGGERRFALYSFS